MVGLPSTTMRNPGQMKQFIRQNTALSAPSPKNKFEPLSGAACADSSYDKMIGIDSNAQFVSTITHTADDGVLLAGLVSNQTISLPQYQQYGLLIKTDNTGNVLWSSEITDPLSRSIYMMQLTFVSELQNGDIIAAGLVDTSQTNSDPDHAVIARFTSTGTLLWYKSYNYNQSVNNDFLPFDVRSVSEAPGGNLLFCGNVSHNALSAEFIMCTDNAGNKIWDNNFQYASDISLGSNGVAAFYENGNVTVIGVSFGVSNLPPQIAVHFLTLDFSTGNLLTSRFFLPNYASSGDQYLKSFNEFLVHAVQLINGHYLVYGQTILEFTQTSTPIDHFGVIEFDSGHNLFDAYTLTDNLYSNSFYDNLYFDPNGNGLFMLFSNPVPNTNVLLGSLREKQISKERSWVFSNGEFGGHGNSGPNQQFCYFNDGGYLLGESFFIDNQISESYIDFRKMHDEDTSSICLGKDTLTEHLLPYHIIENPNYPFLGSAMPNQVQTTAVNFNFLDTFSYRYLSPCNQKSSCDTMKIHGDTLVCNSSNPQIFSIYKNPLCGSFALWNIDTTVVDTMYTVNDTSLAIVFKSVNWKGNLYASLYTGPCATTLGDSLAIHLTKSPGQLNLGPDTTLCAGDSIRLSAGAGFASYLWQDGSTDSLLVVKKPGTYYVTAMDSCRNFFTDTLLISVAAYPFSIGNDTSKCNQDTLILVATPGFSNYQWGSSYNILVSVTGDTARVFPFTDTSYIAGAEKSPGCFVQDTIRIKVLTSPQINLGNDTSFCVGQTVVLDAGPGFSSYGWNTGAITEKITVDAAGLFAVRAEASDGCVSSDSFRVITVSPLPQFSLGGMDTSLCAGQLLQYHFMINGAKYIWSDGSSSGNKIISSPGIWWLEVSNGGCSATDSIDVVFKPLPILQLGNDTTICAGDTLPLNAFNNGATYLWQDGSSSATYSVLVTGEYRVMVSLGGCAATDSVFVSYHSAPHFTLGGNEFICEGEQIQLHGDTDSAFTFRWQDGSAQSTYPVQAPGLYSLTETNACGSFTDSALVSVGSCKLHMPSAFSPDNNGDNDLFRVKYPFPVSSFEFIIFNRWGQKVFETTDISKGWDGKLNGVDQPIGAYVWMIYCTTQNNQKESAKGTVVLIR